MSSFKYKLNHDEPKFLDGKLSHVSPNTFYEIKFFSKGTFGNKFSAYFKIELLDSNGCEINKKIKWLNDFSGHKKEYKIIFKTNSYTKYIYPGYRINDHESFPSNIQIEFDDPNLLHFKKVEPNTEDSNELLYHPEWQKNRINFLINRYRNYFEKSKNLVNMGSYEGDLSYLITREFSKIHCLNEEGRKKNLEKGSKKYPQFDWKQIDYENCDLEKLPKADIVLNMGLFYHISPKKAKEVFMTSIKRAQKIVFFETEVVDCDNENYCLETSGNINDFDQALSDFEIKPSILYINKIIEECGFEYDFIESSELNGGNHIYDWEIKNTKTWKPFSRKFWVIKID